MSKTSNTEIAGSGGVTPLQRPVQAFVNSLGREKLEDV